MQHINRRSHQAAAIDIVLELASEAIAGSGFAHFIKQLAIFIQEIQALRILFAGFVIKGECLFAKTILEQRANAVVTFRIVSRIGLANLRLRGAHPSKRLFGRHEHAMRIRNILFVHQLVADKLKTATVRIVSQREIANTVEVCFAGKRILTQSHVGIAQEHAGTATAPKEGFLGRINQGWNCFSPLFLLKVHKAYAELGPLALDIILEALVRKSLVASNGAIVHFFLFIFKTLHPQVVRIFLTELASILQGCIHLADFSFVATGIVAIQAQNRLHPQGASFHRIQQELELLNGFVIALERTQGHCTLFPQSNAGIYVQRTRGKLFLQRIFRRRERCFRRKRYKHRI